MAGLSRFIKQHKAAFFSFVAITSVALVSSGSAMWMLTLKAMGEKTGNVYVGVVTDAKVVFSDVEFTDKCNRISFDAAVDDSEGRVRYDGSNGEHLTVTLTGKLNAYNFVKYCTYQLTVPESIQKAIDIGYIALNTGGDKYDSNLDYIKSPQEFTLTGIKNEDGTDSGIASFSVTVGFIWGEYFKGLNPSIYYDSNLVESKTIEQITSEFNQFRRTMYGYADGETVPNNVNDLQFTVTLTALTSGSYSSSTTTSEGNQ